MEEIQQLIKERRYKEAYSRLKKIDQDKLYIEGKYDILVSLYTVLLNSGIFENGEKAEIESKLGRIYYRQGDFERAEKLLLKSSSIDGNKLKLFALSVLGGLLVDKGEKEKAMEVLDKAINLSKQEGDLQIYAGSLVRKAKLILDNNIIKARELTEEAVSIAKDNNWERDLMIWNGYLIDIREKEGEDKSVLLEEVLGLKKYFENNNDVRYIKQQDERIQRLG